MSKFHANLDEAKRAELAVVQMFKRAGREAWLNNGNNKACDVYLKGQMGNIPLEVKTDWESIATGNVAIEPQTLNHTSSEYFIYLLPKPYIITTNELRQLYNLYPKTKGGDQSMPLALVPKTDFYKSAKELTNDGAQEAS